MCCMGLFPPLQATMVQSAIQTLVNQGKFNTRVLVTNFGPQNEADAESHLK